MGSHYYEELAYAANVPAIKRVQHDCVCKVLAFALAYSTTLILTVLTFT